MEFLDSRKQFVLCLELEEEKEQELDFGMEDRRDNSSLLKSSELAGGKK